MDHLKTLAQLRDTLAGLYLAEADVQRVLADSGLDARRIRFGTSAQNLWHAVLMEANRAGKLEALLALAESEYPDNLELRVALAGVRKALLEQPDWQGWEALAPTGPGRESQAGGVVTVDLGVDRLVRSMASFLVRPQTLAVLAFLILAGAGIWWWSNRLPKMDGDFNIAVALPTQLEGSADTGLARKIQVRLVTYLQDEMSRAFGACDDSEDNACVQVRDIPRSISDFGSEENRSASKLLGDVGAQLLIYGTLSDDDFSPRFYIYEGLDVVTDQSYIGGSQALGQPISNELWEEQLPARAETLSHFSIGLVQLLDQQYSLAYNTFDAATRTFQQALVAENGHPLQGEEVLHYFQGVALLSRNEPGDLERARQIFQMARDANPEEPYVRAYLGLGNVVLAEFQQSDFQASSDLDPAFQSFDQVLAARPQEADYLHVRAQFHLGRAYDLQARFQALFCGPLSDRPYKDADAAWRSVLRVRIPGEIEDSSGLCADYLASLPKEAGWPALLGSQVCTQLGGLHLAWATAAAEGRLPGSAEEHLAESVSSYEASIKLAGDDLDQRLEGQLGLAEVYLAQADLGARELYARAESELAAAKETIGAGTWPATSTAPARRLIALGKAYDGQGRAEDAASTWTLALEYLQSIESLGAEALTQQVQSLLNGEKGGRC